MAPFFSKLLLALNQILPTVHQGGGLRGAATTLGTELIAVGGLQPIVVRTEDTAEAFTNAADGDEVMLNSGKCNE